jgi:protein archease
LHRWVEHTGELELTLEASDEAEVFAAALAALRELLDDGSTGPAERRRVTLRSPERATLLADWIDELVFLAETEDFVAERVDAFELRPDGLDATVLGRRGRPPHLVKAVTYHGLEFAADGDRVRARAVLDV